MYMFNFWCKYKKRKEGIFDRSKFKVTRDISPTISRWLLVHSESAAGTWMVQKEFEFVTLADFLCCC